MNNEESISNNQEDKSKRDKLSDEEAGYNKWRSICVEKLQGKLRQNVAKRKKNFEDVVTNEAHKILRDNKLDIISNPPDFKISDTITNTAYDRMCETISAWPGVHLTQCKKLPPIFKKYWRIADNWWNRQKGKWFGDLFFQPILQYSLHRYCKKILIHPENQIEFDYLFYIFLYDILHSKVSFKKARPNPLIFDLALEKSPKLQQWFTMAGNQHGVEWKIDKAPVAQKKSIKDWAQDWVNQVKALKCQICTQYKCVNGADISQILNVFPSMNNSSPIRINNTKQKRNSDSRKSNVSTSSSSNHNNDSDNSQDSGKDDIFHSKYETTNNNTHQKSDQECKRLSEALAQQAQHCAYLTRTLAAYQQKEQMMTEQLQYAQYFAQQQFINQQINEAHYMDAVQQIESQQQQQQEHNGYIKQEHISYGITDEKSQQQHSSQYFMHPDININQPTFLPQPARSHSRASNPTPDPLPLPPPLKTEAGRERRQSYHDVLLMKQYVQDIQPESVHSLHTNHSTVTNTTVVSNMHNNRQQTPNTLVSTPSGSDVSVNISNCGTYGGNFYFAKRGPSHNNPMMQVGGLPQLQIYQNAPNQYNQYGYYHNNGVQHYNSHLPPPILPQINPSPIRVNNNTTTPTNLLPPPPPRTSQISHGSHPSLSAQSHHSHSNNNNAHNGLITPPNHSNNNSFDMLNSSFANDNMVDNNYVPLDDDVMMDLNIGNILNGLNGSNMHSNSNLDLRLNNSGPNLSDNPFSSNPNMNSIGNMSISYKSMPNGQMSISNVRMENDL